jgi:nucleoside phosphorylase
MERASAKILLLTAVADELGQNTINSLSPLCHIELTGVGKLRAFEATLAALEQGDYDHIINVGTCGSFHHAPATILYPSRIVQGDIYIASDFSTSPIELGTGYEECSIVSSDNFIGSDTAPSQIELLRPYDCMDMESYAIARAIAYHTERRGKAAPKLHLIKIVSDAADGTLEEWSQRIERLQSSLKEALSTKIEQINNPSK